jgi:hypothetical protein
MTECNQELFSFTAHFSRRVEAGFAAGTWGNSGRNTFQGPGTQNVGFSVFKNTPLAETKVLQLRAEFFNLFNTAQFNNPGATVGTAAFGTVSSAGSAQTSQRTERQIQFGHKSTSNHPGGAQRTERRQAESAVHRSSLLSISEEKANRNFNSTHL